MSTAIVSLQGTASLLEVFNDKIVLTPTGSLGKASQKGVKTLYLNQISGVQFKQAATLSAGYISLTLVGGREKTGGVLGAAYNENSVLFSKKDNEAAEAAKNKIEELIAAANVPTGAGNPASGTNYIEQIEKLSALKEKGILSPEEFETKKAELLSKI